MRILVDENLSPMIAAALQAAGHDVLMVTAVLPAAPDDDVVKLAIAAGRVLITEDKDFGELAFRVGHRLPGLIRLVLPGLRQTEKATRLCQVLVDQGDTVVGRAVVIERRRVRSRALP